MLTAIPALVASILASAGFKVAEKLFPYIVRAVPFLALIVACVVGYHHDDAIARWSLALAVANEAIVATMIYLFVAK